MAYRQTMAIARAKAWIGDAYPAGWCQKWVVTEIFASGGVGDWDGDRAADAEDGWKAAKKKVATSDAFSVPAGYPIYFLGGSSDHGHAAVSAGGGYMYTTDRPYTGKIGKVLINSVESLWGVTFVGYVITDGNGNTFTDLPSTPAVPTWGKPETWVIGGKGPDVLRMGQRINAWNAVLGLPTWTPDDVFSSTERNALAELQKAWGWGIPDGYPGTRSFTKLAETPVKPAPVVTRHESSLFIQNCASQRSDVGAGSWGARRQILADVMLASDASFLICPELYSGERPWMVNALSSKYALAGYREGRVLFHHKARWKTGPGFFWKNLLWGTRKPLVVDSFQNLVNGTWLTVSAWHTTWNTDAEGSRRRRIEVKTGIEYVKSLRLRGRKIWAGDFNAPADSTTRTDDVEPVFEAYGYHDLEDDHEVRNGPGFYHLDRGFAGEGVEGEEIHVKVHEGSDHPGTFIKFSY